MSVNKSLKSDCLDDIDLNLSSKDSSEIELEDPGFVFEHNIQSIVESIPRK